MADRISDLPNQLLTHILTLVPIKEAVRTGILSKRWIDVWTSLQILVFDDHKYLGADLTDNDFLLRDYKFLKFVHYVLFRCRETSPLDTFKLKWCSKFSETYSVMSQILSFAAKIMPRVLTVNIRTKEPFFLPGSIFLCPSVEEMSLAVNFNGDDDHFIGAESINLPHLRKLELLCQQIDDDFITMLLSGCPILEELVFYHCHFKIKKISSTVLRKLTFTECLPINDLQISCPGVVSLDMGFSGSEGIILKNMASLVTANLDFESTCNTRNHDMKLLRGLSTVASLSLNTNYLTDLLATNTQNCPIFNNLKSLHLRVLDMDLHLSLVFFLRHSSNLETLSLEFLECSPVADILNFPILNNLKMLVLGDFIMDYHWNLVVSLLQHSPNLETLNLSFCWQASEDATKEEFLGDVPFQLEYLERVNIICYKRNAKFAKEVVRRLSVFIKSIGEVIVDIR